MKTRNRIPVAWGHLWLSIALSCIFLAGAFLFGTHFQWPYKVWAAPGGPCKATYDGTTLYSSVQAAVDAAPSGGTVKVSGDCLGVQYTNGTSQTVFIAKPLTLRGGYNGSDWTTSSPENYPTTLNAQSGGRVAVLKGSGPIVIENITLSGGKVMGDTLCPDSCGGGMLVGSKTQATLKNVTVENNVTNGAGGGIYTSIDSSLQLINTSVLSNTADYEGGGAYAESVVTLSGGRFANNTSDDAGGGLYGEDKLTAENTWFLNNRARNNGAGLFVRGEATLIGTRFERNVSNRGYGGGFYGNGVATLNNVQFVENTARSGGGGAYTNDTVALDGSSFQKNRAIDYGGGLYTNGPLNIQNSSFTQNTITNKDGGGIYAFTEASLNNVSLEQNSTVRYGGGVYARSTLKLNNVRIISNVAQSDGGGVYTNGDATLTTTQCEANWSKSNGGGLYANGTSALVRSSINRNQADSSGGGVYGTRTLILSDTQIFSNTAQNGGGIYAQGTSTFIGGIIHGNHATANGGGVFVPLLSTLSISKTHVTTNSAQSGAGLYTQGVATIGDARIEQNRATRFGGGVFADHMLTLSTTHVLSNVAQIGGGVYLFASDGGNSSMVNSLFIRNTANDGQGMAMHLFDSSGTGGKGLILHTTIVTPTSSSGSAISVGAGQVQITNTIIVSHSVGIDAIGGTVSENYNLFAANGKNLNGIATVGNHSIIVADPFFMDAAQDNYLPVPPSQAIDAAMDVHIMRDIVNHPRPGSFTPFADIGAYEAQGVYPDLLIEKSVTPAGILPGQMLTYTLKFANQGTGRAGGVQVIDPLTPTIKQPIVTSSGAEVVNSGQTPAFLWNVEDLAPQASGIITIAAMMGQDAPPAGTIVMNTATITSATFEQDGKNNDSAIGIKILKAGTTTSLDTTPNPSSFGQSVNLRAKVTILPPGSGSALGQVTFLDGKTILGSSALNNGVATLITSTLTAGSHAIIAKYEGTDTYAASDSPLHTHIVNDIPIKELQAINSSPTMSGTATLFTATVKAGTNIVYTWDFGDGKQATGITTTHVYTEAGLFQATVKATNTAGSVSANTLVTITSTNVSSLVVNPNRGRPGSAFTFRGSAFDPRLSLAIRVNGVTLPLTQPLVTDDRGRIVFVLLTEGVHPGRYVVEIGPTSTTLLSSLASATTTIYLVRDAALVEREPGLEAREIVLPTTVRPADTLYAPFISR